MPSSSNTTSNAHPSAAPLSSAGGGGAAFLIRTIDTLRARASDPHHYSLSKLRRHPSVASLLAAAEEAFVAASSQHSSADSSQGASGGVSGDLLSSASTSSSQEVAAGDLPRPLIYFFVGDDLCDSEEDGAAAKAAQSGGGSAPAAVRWSLRQVGSLRVSDRLSGRDVTIRRHEYCATAGGPSRDDADDAAAIHDGDNNNNSITKINNNEGSASSSSSAAVAVVETFEESGFLPLCRLFVERRAAAVAQQSCPIFRLLRGGSGSGSDDAIGLTSPPLSPPPEDGEGLFSCKTNDSSSAAATAMFAFPSERPLLASAIAMHCTAASATAAAGGALASAFAHHQHSSRCGAIVSSSNSSSCIATTGGGVGGAALDVSSSYAGISSHGGAATDTANTSSALHDISGASLQLQQTPPTGATADVSIVLVMNATTNADGEGSSGSSGGDSGRERENRERGGGVDDLSTVAAESGGDFASASAAYTTTVPPCALSAEAAGRLADGLAAALLTSRTAMIPRDASSHNAYPPTAAVAAAAEQGGAQQSGISSHTASQQQLSQQTQQSQQSQSQQLTLQQQQQEMMKNELLRMGGHQHSGPMPQHGSTAVSSLDVSAVGPSHHQHNNANTLSSSSVRGAVAVGGASAKGGRAEEDEENDRAFSAPQRPAATAGGQQQQQQQQQAAVAEEQTHHDQQQQSLLDPFLVSSLAPRTNASSLSAAHWQAAGDGRCESVWSQRTADKQQQQQQRQFPQKSSRHLAPSVAGLTFSSSNPPSADRGPDPSRFFLGQPSAKALAASKHIVTYFHPQDEGRAAAAAQLNGAAEYAYAIADPSARAAATAAAAERARRRAKGDEDPFNYQQQLAPNQIAYSYDGTSPFWTQKPFWFQTVMADHVQRTVDYGRGAAAAGWKRWRVGPLQSVERSVIVNSVDEVCSFLRVSRAGFFASVALLDTFLNVCEAPAHRRFDAARFRHNLVASGGSCSSAAAAAAAVAEIDPLAVDDADDSVSFTADFSHPNADLLDANNFRCLIIAAVYVAAKLHDVQPPHVRRVIEALGVPVTTDALCQTELRLISTLHFCTHPLTLPDVTAYFAHFPLRPTMDYCRLRWRDVGAKKAAALRNSSTSGLMGSTSVSAAVADMQHQQGASTSASMMGHPPASASISGSTSAAPPPPSPPAFVPDYTAPLPLPIIDSLRFNIRNIVALVSDIFIRQPAAIAYPSLVAGAAVFKVAVDMSDCAAIVNYEEDDDGYDILEGCGAATVPIEDIKAAAAAAAEARAHPSASAASADASAALSSPLLDPSLIVARIEQLRDLLQHYKPRSLGGGGYVGFMVRALRGLLGSAALPMPPQERLGQYYTMRCGMRRDAAVERANRVVAIRRAIQELSAIAVAEEARAAEAEARRAAKALRQQQRQGVVRHIDPTASDCDAINSLSCPPHLISSTTAATNANFDSNAALLDDNDNSNMIGFGVGDATHHNGEDDEDDDAYNTNTPCKYGILAQQQQQRAGAPSRSGGAHRSQQQQNGGEDSSNDSSSAVLLGGEETVMLMPQTDGTTAEEAAAGTPPIGYAPMAGRSGALPLPPSVVSSQQQQQPLPIASALTAMAASVDAHVDALLCFEEEGFDAATVAIQCYLSEAEADVASACVAALLPDGALHPSLLERGRLPVSPSLPQGILSRYGESLISGFATSLARCLVLRTQQRDKLNALHLSLQQPPHRDGLTGQF